MGRRDVGTAIICRSCWDNAERRGRWWGRGRYGNELRRNPSLFNGMLPHSLRHRHCHRNHCHWNHHWSSYLLDPGVRSLCRLFLNQFDTWKVKLNEFNSIKFHLIWTSLTRGKLNSINQCGYNFWYNIYTDAMWIEYLIQYLYWCNIMDKKTCVRVRPVFFARVLFSSGVGYLIYQNT